MKIYIDTKGVLRWSPNGWPHISDFKAAFMRVDYEDALSRAKAESVPVKDQIAVRKIMGHHYLNGRKINTNSLMWDKDTFYEVPDEEIKPEWL